jgi:hypothetical protein
MRASKFCCIILGLLALCCTHTNAAPSVCAAATAKGCGGCTATKDSSGFSNCKWCLKSSKCLGTFDNDDACFGTQCSVGGNGSQVTCADAAPKKDAPPSKAATCKAINVCSKCALIKGCAWCNGKCIYDSFAAGSAGGGGMPKPDCSPSSGDDNGDGGDNSCQATPCNHVLSSVGTPVTINDRR